MEFVKNVYESFVAINGWTMIFAWCNLLIVYLFLKKLLFKPVKNMIDSRQQEIDGMYSDAEADRKNAEAMKAEYEQKISTAEEDSENIRRAALRQAQLKEEEILKDANEKAQRILERASEEVELEKKRALNEVKNEVSELAIGIASRVIERDVSKEEHKELIDSFIDGIGEGNG